MFKKALLLLAISLLVLSVTAVGAQDEEVIVGLITKTETNPFFVKMREGAQEKADELGLTLLTAAGTFDGDNESQVTAIENMTAAGAVGILITPSDTSAIVPAIEMAREQGVVVIALDTPTDPEEATDALFATDNYQAGILIGEYARASFGDTPAVIATLDLAPGITVGELRRSGFLDGFGVTDADEVVCAQDTRGDQAMGQTAMENCLTANPDINLVYTINEPAAFGAFTALENAGMTDDVMIVSVDGGCAGVEGVLNGQIAATSQQYPLAMASLGVEALAAVAAGEAPPSGYVDTGVTLIAGEMVEGVEAEDPIFGIENCWGDPSEDALAAVEAAMDDGDMMEEEMDDMEGMEEGEETSMDLNGEGVTVGLITKTETNPFFVKMREGAQEKADELGAELMTAAGTFDGDNESQVIAIENMTAAGAQGILITPSDTSAIVPAIEAAREQGVTVIALDTPTDPEDATDALFATDNYQAGILIGEYARASFGDEPAVIATLDLAPGITVGELRRSGFLDGFGVTDADEVVCAQDTRGDQAMGQTAMENCLTANPEINLVYTINEPAAFGAYTALENAGVADDVMIVSVDGGCAGVEGIVSGQIAATSQQYPLVMASLGVETIVSIANGAEPPVGYTDTGVTLITDMPVEGVESEDTEFGLANCWG